jgi:tripartite-type tricarboxylate transporter receptor subunit TctC
MSESTMKISRRKVFRLAAGAAAFSAVPRIALAQSYPAKPIRLVVGFAPGGSTDIAARVIGQRLSERLGQQVVIENRAGAGSNIAVETVVRAPADGYTLLLVSSADTINATLYRKLSFNFIRDIAPVAGLTQQPQIMMASPALPAKTFAELIAYAKANPGKVTIASAGNGAISHLAGELLKTAAGIDLVHMPYRGSGPALTDLLGGHVLTSFAGMAGSIEFVRAGRLRALAVTTAKRSAALPDVPAIAEFYPGFEAVSMFGIGAPQNTPAGIIGRLNTEINLALADPKIEARFGELGGAVLPGTPAAFGKLIADETEKWGKVITAAGIKSE